MGVGGSVLEGFGFTPQAALVSLDAQIAYKYNSTLLVDRDTGRHFVNYNNYPRYVELFRAPHGGSYRAVINL